MGGCFNRAFFLLELFGDDLDPDHVTRTLGIEPTRRFRKGDSSPKGSQFERTGGWILESEAQDLSDDDPGPERFETWAKALPGDEVDWHSLEPWRPTVRLALYTDQWNADFVVTPATLLELHRRRLPLSIDPYLSLDE
jgi:hypothetical protein